MSMINYHGKTDRRSWPKEESKLMTTQLVQRAASLWYPVMLAQQDERISESKAAELLGLNLEEYRKRKWEAMEAVEKLVVSLPSPLTSLLDVMKERPELLTPKD